MKTNLYNITTDYLTLIEEIENNDGELTETLEQALTLNKADLDYKALAYKEVIGTKESLNTRIDEEIKRLQAIKKSNNNVIARLKDNLLNAVNPFGPWESNFCKFGTRKSTQVIVEDVNSLPPMYKVVKITESANKAEIKRVLKTGETIEGCELKEVLNLKIS